MKDVAVVRDVLKDALENVNGIIKTYEEIKKVINLKLRVVMPGFNKDLFTIDCKEKDGVIVPVKFTYTHLPRRRITTSLVHSLRCIRSVLKYGNTSRRK